MQELSVAVAAALARRGVAPGDKVAILSANDPVAFTCVFGITRAGAVWCPINPRNEAAENRELLDLFDCGALIFQARVRPAGASGSGPTCRKLHDPGLPRRHRRTAPSAGTSSSGRRSATGGRPMRPVDDLAMIVGTGGTTGRPKGVMLTGTNLETMTALTLMGYPFDGRPVYLALAPLTHAAGVLCFPVLALGGEIVIMRTPDVGAFLGAGRAAPGHAHVPAADADLHGARRTRRWTRTDLSSLQCFWYGAAPMSATRLEEALTADRPGDGAAVRPDRGADDDLDDGAARPLPTPTARIARERLSSAGRPAPLVTVAIMADGRHAAARAASAARSWSAARW